MHLLLDFTTTRGVPLFYPIETLRYSADVFYQIEPIVLVATLIVLAALVRDRSIVRFNKGLFVVFVVFLLVVGGLRFEGKQSALANFSGDNAKAFPESGLFSWAVLENETDRFLVYEYDYLNGNVSAGSVFPRLIVASSLQEAKKAIALAEKLSWVRIFRWRAYSVAINATFTENGSWDIEYYDPLVRVETHDSASLLRLPSKNYGAVRVTVQGKLARMAE
jgi:inner membrane protein